MMSEFVGVYEVRPGAFQSALDEERQYSVSDDDGILRATGGIVVSSVRAVIVGGAGGDGIHGEQWVVVSAGEVFDETLDLGGEFQYLVHVVEVEHAEYGRNELVVLFEITAVHGEKEYLVGYDGIIDVGIRPEGDGVAMTLSQFGGLNVVDEVFLLLIAIDVVFVDVGHLYDFVVVEGFVGVVSHGTDLGRRPFYQGGGASFSSIVVIVIVVVIASITIAIRHPSITASIVIATAAATTILALFTCHDALAVHRLQRTTKQLLRGRRRCEFFVGDEVEFVFHVLSDAEVILFEPGRGRCAPGDDDGGGGDGSGT
mmetsp:Transcript_28378/g.51835  ORF Transcript_28378/g.51835 Transcript_28378/m.51835 type:complete len:314 (+) Transcript_28378:766-1707(+)